MSKIEELIKVGKTCVDLFDEDGDHDLTKSFYNIAWLMFYMKAANARTEIEQLHTIAQEMAEALDSVQELCLCERFKTKGFDYGEKHPIKGKCDDGRWLTPKDIVKKTLTNWNKYKEQE